MSLAAYALGDMARPELRQLRTETDEFQLALSLLTNRKQRQRQRRFVVEGVRAIDEAVKHAWPIDSFWFAADGEPSRWARSLLEAGVAAKHFALTAKLMARLSGKDEPSELVAIARIPDDDLARINLSRDALVVVFDRPASPGNLGSVIRSCDALGADGLIVTGHAVDPYDPQTVRASVGALFALPVVRVGSPGQVLKWVKPVRDPDVQVVGSSAHASAEASEQDFTCPTVLVLGNETSGLSWTWRETCDAVVRIPMGGSATSLNVAAAAAILLYEIARQRRSA